MIGVGLSITHDGFKAAIVDKIEDRFIIKKVMSSNFENEIINNGNIELEEQFVTSLGKFVTTHSLMKKNIVLSYFNQKINFRNFSVPIMNEKELKKAVQWQIADDLAISFDELVYDYAISSMEEDKYNILAVVAKKDDLFKYMSLVSEAGLNIKIVDLPNSSSIYPMSRDFFVSQGYTVIFDIEYDSSNITFLVNDNISFVRNMNIGLKRLLSTLSSETPYKFSEIIKDKELLEKNYVYFEDFYASLSNELQNSIWFYESNFIKKRSTGTTNIKN